MTTEMTREERKAAVVAAAVQMFDEIDDWYEENPEATFEEIEARARHSRRELMGRAFEVWINGRGTGKQREKPACPECGQGMENKGQVSKTVCGVEGDTQLARTYYRCPNKCEEGAFFPSGQAAKVEK